MLFRACSGGVIPRRVLDAAREGAIDLYTSVNLLAELEDVLSRDKFAKLLTSVGVTPHDLVLGYAALSSVVVPPTIEPVILADPDDDAVLACVVAAQGEVIVSGDRHLLDLKKYAGIRILTAATLVAEIS
ncbi:MAG TPA: putative toxin-antitoxin system toxin component, PIN family [Pyrinomonadaceae bacterium]|nr:putative toxin-antitoxin system toxin component, PIN family [Pyrinomonadaceae bacterium]